MRKLLQRGSNGSKQEFMTMEGRKRQFFYLLLGASGIMLILTSHLIGRERRQDILLVAANFHNGSLAYLTALNVNVSFLRSGDLTLRKRLIHQKQAGFSVKDDLLGNSEHSSNFKGDLNHLVNKNTLRQRISLKNWSIETGHYNSGYEKIHMENSVTHLFNKSTNLKKKTNELSSGMAVRKSDVSNKNISKIIDSKVTRNDVNKSSLRSENSQQHGLNIQNSVYKNDIYELAYNKQTPSNILSNVSKDVNKFTNLNTKAHAIKNRIEVNTNSVSDEIQTKMDNVYPVRSEQKQVDVLKIVTNNDQHPSKARVHNDASAEMHYKKESAIPVFTSINEPPTGSLFLTPQITLVSGESSTKEKEPSDRQQASNEGFVLNAGCSSKNTGVEDLLCMSRPNFLPNFRNPCWYQAGKLKCLPYFYIMGVCKTGTSDLFTRMSHHPQIVTNRGIFGKETWYWSWRRYGQISFWKKAVPKMTLDEFSGMFDSQTLDRVSRRLENGTQYHHLVTGHGDPMDFWDQTAWRLIPQNDPRADMPEVTTPRLVRHVNPEVKLILLLRDPVERLFSLYLHGRYGTNAREFHADVMTSLTMLNNCTRNRELKACLYDKEMLVSLPTPISSSFYSVHLKEWLKAFPRKQMFITRTEDFSSDIAGTLLQIFQFLRLDPMPTNDIYRISNMPHFYVSKAKQTSGDVYPETRAALEKVFRPYNTELAAILGDPKFDFNHRDV
ncbi:uncharacterized protein LOC128204115 isoform X1 [Mya arenaria]|uniref:uncharacterized protein LOC128204115 isoform X1 n=2 Tax=Mya arenaria TaxID=6604 RepID=UPI0022E0199C|nr:uncharacterized protein LOC128204115 isoform X1 [Mya arenaria]